MSLSTAGSTRNSGAVVPEVKNFIAGEWVDASGDASEDVVNPSTAEVIARVVASGPTDVDRAVQAAGAAQPAWGQTSPADRAAVLNALADACEADREHLARLEAIDAGKPITASSQLEMPGVIDAIRVFANAARTMQSMSPGEYVPAQTSIFRREPVGVVAAITPWNYPLLQAVCKLAPALATGNTVVLKPAETTPMSVARFAELSADLLPPGALNVINGFGPTTGSALVAHEEVDLVSFTGSVAGGRSVGELAGRGIKRAIMELGGNAPVLVFDDADLAFAADAIAEAGLYNAGQECMSASRLLVHESVESRFTELLATAVKAIRIGDTLDPQTVLGPLTSAAHRDRVEGFLSRRPSHADVVLGGGRPDAPGFFLEPTIFAGLRQADELVQEEIFGPVFTIQTFSDDTEALSLANGTRYGLAASIWTENVGRAMRVSNALDFGTVWVNAHLALAPELPVGGFGASGHGVENGLFGIAEYTRVKHVAINYGPRD